MTLFESLQQDHLKKYQAQQQVITYLEMSTDSNSKPDDLPEEPCTVRAGHPHALELCWERLFQVTNKTKWAAPGFQWLKQTRQRDRTSVWKKCNTNIGVCAGQWSRLAAHAMSTACRVMSFRLGNRSRVGTREGLEKQATGGEFDRLLHTSQCIRSAPPVRTSHLHPFSAENPALGPLQSYALHLKVLIVIVPDREENDPV